MTLTGSILFSKTHVQLVVRCDGLYGHIERECGDQGASDNTRLVPGLGRVSDGQTIEIELKPVGPKPKKT